MKRYFCKECSGILPKGKIVCDKCGYDNPELIYVLREKNKRKIVIRRIVSVAAVIALIVILNANLLFPWQWRALNNKWAIIDYAKEHYPGAKIVDQDYETAQFVIGRTSIDRITFKWNDVEFNISTERGKYIQDNYWFGVAGKAVYETFLDPYFKDKEIKFDHEIIASDIAAFLEEDPKSDITNFDGEKTRIIIYPKYIKGKNTPQSLGWLYDFYCYCKENILLRSYRVTVIYHLPGKSDWYIHFEQDSDFNSEEDFYMSFFLG